MLWPEHLLEIPVNRQTPPKNHTNSLTPKKLALLTLLKIVKLRKHTPQNITSLCVTKKCAQPLPRCSSTSAITTYLFIWIIMQVLFRMTHISKFNFKVDKVVSCRKSFYSNLRLGNRFHSSRFIVFF